MFYRRQSVAYTASCSCGHLFKLEAVCFGVAVDFTVDSSLDCMEQAKAYCVNDIHGLDCYLNAYICSMIKFTLNFNVGEVVRFILDVYLYGHWLANTWRCFASTPPKPKTVPHQISYKPLLDSLDTSSILVIDASCTLIQLHKTNLLFVPLCPSQTNLQLPMSTSRASGS